jgi:hypothetical protein
MTATTLAAFIDLKERIAINKAFSPAERDFILTAVNDAAKVVDLSRRPKDNPSLALHSPPNHLGRIDQIWAFLSVDDGGEGVCGLTVGGDAMLPMVAADKRIVETMIPHAVELATVSGKPVRLAKFTKREDMQIYRP